MTKKYGTEIGLYKEEFDNIVKSFDMKCKHTIKFINGKNMIVESWTSEINPFVSINRVYDVLSDSLSQINPKKRKNLLKKILAREVESENYEEAAIVRDLILEIK